MSLVACNEPPTSPVPPTLDSSTLLPVAAVPGWELVDTPRVRVLDGSGRPLAGVEVYWTVQAGSGSVTVLNSTTDPEGYSAVRWRLGPAEGVNRLRAILVAGDTLEFEVEGEIFRASGLVADGGMACAFQAAELWCWGPKFWGSGPPTSKAPPDQWAGSPGLLDDTHGFVEAAVASYLVCARDAAGSVWCYREGKNPVQVLGLPPVRQLVGTVSYAVGLVQRFCALAVSDSTAWCWAPDSTPSPIAGSPAFARIWISKADPVGINVPFPSSRGCGTLSDSAAVCWGRGPPGDGSQLGEYGLHTVGGDHRFVELSVVDQASCGRTMDGEIWCWGRRFDGWPVLLPELTASGATLLSGYLDVFLASRAASTLSGWVRVFGPTLPTITGVPGAGFSSFAFNSSTCALAAYDRVYCSNDLVNKVVFSTLPEIKYAPVQPVRRFPLAASPQ